MCDTGIWEDLTDTGNGLTDLVKNGPERGTVKSMILQYRMVLDLMLAEKGDVCTIIAD